MNTGIYCSLVDNFYQLFYISIWMDSSKEEKNDKKEKSKDTKERRKRSESPYASKDDIKSKKI